MEGKMGEKFNLGKFNERWGAMGLGDDGVLTYAATQRKSGSDASKVPGIGKNEGAIFAPVDLNPKVKKAKAE